MRQHFNKQHDQQRVHPLRTPYHSLGGDHEMHVPDWAQHRSVYRASGRTLYLVETDSLSEARADLHRLGRAGWDVRVDEDPAAPGSRARIVLTRRDLAKAA
ncbi:MAG: hypothetical protein ACK5LO_04005 [Leucobacter sp.]